MYEFGMSTCIHSKLLTYPMSIGSQVNWHHRHWRHCMHAYTFAYIEPRHSHTRSNNSLQIYNPKNDVYRLYSNQTPFFLPKEDLGKPCPHTSMMLENSHDPRTSFVIWRKKFVIKNGTCAGVTGSSWSADLVVGVNRFWANLSFFRKPTIRIHHMSTSESLSHDCSMSLFELIKKWSPKDYVQIFEEEILRVQKVMFRVCIVSGSISSSCYLQMKRATILQVTLLWNQCPT